MAVSEATHTAQRRVFYGANVAIQIVLAVLIVVGAVYVARDRGQADLTRSGVNSLSDRTLKLLRGLDENVTITAIYTVLSEYDELAQKRQDTVRDLLRLYESSGRGRITANLIDPMENQGALVVLLKRLREKEAYRDESSEHEQVFAEYPELNRKVLALFDGQLTEIERLLNADPELERSTLAEVSQELERQRRRSETTSAETTELLGYDIPRHGRAAETARRQFEAVQRWFEVVKDWVENKAPAAPNLPADVLAFMQKANEDYQALAAEVDSMLERLGKLNRTELEQLSDQLNAWPNSPPIVVETEREARVVPFFDTWPPRQSGIPGPDNDQREFAGEQVISSAILRLTQKEKTAVVFTRFGGPSPIMPDFSQANMMRRMPRAPYGVLNKLLTEENFITRDWDLKTQKTPPEIEDAARTVYVVFPPEPPPQPDPRRPSPEPSISEAEIQAITAAVDSSGMGVFLTGWAPPATPFPGAPGGTYEFADYLSTKWGVDVRYDYVIVPFMPSTEDPGLYVPTREAQQLLIAGERLRFTDHPIGRPLQASRAAFQRACPLQIVTGSDAPGGVVVEPVVEVKSTDDVWGTEDLNRLNEDFRTRQGTFRRDDDIAAPFPLGLAAEDAEGKRVVVFGGSRFAADSIVELPGGYVFSGGALVAYPAFPANPDMFVNAVHWLTKEADRISLGARRTEVPRLDKLTEGFWLDFWRVFLVGIWPGLALVTGGVVWLFRRR